MSDAQKQLDTLLSQSATTVPRFPANSRYAATATTTLTTRDGQMVIYLRRRFVPQPERFAVLRDHAVVHGDRLDLLASMHFGDPELFWRLCDANGAIRPDDLTEAVGRRLRITLPEGLPEHSDA